MAIATYKKIASVTVGAGGASSIDFTNIPGTYNDLLILHSLRTNQASSADNVRIRFNGSTSNLSYRRLLGVGTSAISQSDNTIIQGAVAGDNVTANTFASGSIYVPNYTSSSNKSVSLDTVFENNSSDAYQDLGAGLWANTSVINSITLVPSGGTLWKQYSTAVLYGIVRSN